MDINGMTQKVQEALAEAQSIAARFDHRRIAIWSVLFSVVRNEKRFGNFNSEKDSQVEDRRR